MDVVAAMAIGLAAGMIAGMLGVGGGIPFVPALSLALGLSHLEAEATSLVAIVPVAVVGAMRQREYGNLRLGDGVAVGVLACGGAVGGVALANAVPQRVLEIAFAGLIVVIAAQLVRSALSSD